VAQTDSVTLALFSRCFAGKKAANVTPPFSQALESLENIMAFREIRFLVKTGNRETDNLITREIYQPFTWYMDALMRGRFKEYSGDEVKGISLVNLCLYPKTKIRDMKERSGGNLRLDEWLPMLNTLQLESEIDLEIFKGSRVENITKSLQIFITHASKSDLPQMKTLVSHLKESLGKQSIEKAIKKADDYLEKLYSK
jgi:hypothetical protein